MILSSGEIVAYIFHWKPLACLTYWQSHDFNIRKHRHILEVCILHVYSIFFVANLVVNFSIIRNIKMDWKLPL